MSAKTAQSKSPKSASENADFFRCLFESHPLPMWIYDLKTLSFLEVNEAALEKYGYSRAEFLKMTLKDIRPPEDVARLESDVKKKRPALQHSGEWRHRLKDGRVVDVEINSHTIEYNGHKAALVTVQDVTERKQVEEALRSSEEKFRNAFLISPDSLTITRLSDGRCVSVNHGFTQILGYTEAEVIGKTSLELGIWEDPRDRQKLVAILQANGIADNFEMRFRTKQGEIRHGLISAAVIELNGEAHILNTTRDVTGRKQAEAFLRESESNLTRAQSIAHIGSWNLDMSSNILAWSAEAYRIFGVAPETPLTYESFLAFVHPDDRDFVDRSWQAVLRGAPYDIEHRILVDGQVKWVRERAVLEVDAEGKSARGIGTVQDITERKQAEEALRHSEALFRGLFENLLEGVYRTTPQGQILSANPALVKMLGYESETELKQVNISQIYVEISDRDEYTKRLVDSGEAYNLELALKRKDGRRIIVLDNARVVRDERGNLLFYEGALTNITERKQVEDALREAESRYRNIFENTTVGFFQSAPQGRFINVNPAMARMFGYDSPEEMLDSVTDIASQIHVDPDRRREFTRLLVEQGQILDFINQNYRKDGSIIWTSSNSRVVKDDEGQTLYYEGFITDITERKQAAEALGESEKRFSAIAEAAGDMIFTVTADGMVSYTNETASRVISPTLQTPIGRHIRDLFPPESFEKQWSSLQKVFETGEPLYVESISHFPHGDVWLSTWLTPLRDNNGRITAVLGDSRNITGRKQAEEQLRLQSAALEASANAIVIATREGLIQWANPAFTALTGYAVPDEVFGKSPRDLIKSGKQDKKFYRNLWETILSGKVWHGELINRRKDGTFYDEEMTITPVQNQQGEISHFIAVKQDITERKQAEDAVYEGQRVFRTLVENSPDIIARYDRDCRRIYINPAYLKTAQMSQQELLTASPAQHSPLPATSAVILQNLLRKVLDSGVAEAVDVIWPKTDNIDYWYNIHATPEFNREGLVESVMTISRDITKRKQVEEELREREARYHNLFEDSPISLWEEDFSAVKQRLDALRGEGITDFRSYFESHPQVVIECAALVKVLDVNKVTLKLHGAKHKDELLSSLTKIFEDQTINAFEDELIKIAGGQTQFEWEGVNQTLNGEKLLVNLRWSVVPGHEQTLDRVIVSLMDVTARRQAEEKIRQVNVELEQRVEERTRELREAQEQLIRQEKLAVLGQLAGGVGHELRNPLAVINNAVYYLKLIQPDADVKIKDYLGMIERETHTAEKIITDLLDFARVKSVDRELVSVSALIQSVLTRFPAPPDVTVFLDIPFDVPQVFADSRQMEQVLGNLVVNACQAMPSGGKLSVISCQSSVKSDALLTENWLLITVQDTGMGISPENMKKLFEPLFTTKLKGIGLGLAVSKKLVEANGGRIEVQSEAGVGSTFTVWLPVAPSSDRREP